MGAVKNYDRLTCEIRVKKQSGDLIKFYSCVSIEIETSYDVLTDKATVTLPYDNRWIKMDENGFNRVSIVSGNGAGFFSIGDAIEIYYGYNFNNVLEFEGFITGIEPKAPLVLTCEDKSWKLKKNRLMFTTRAGATLKEVVEKHGLLKGTGVEIHPLSYTMGIEFGKLAVRNITAAKLLDEWRDMGIISYMRDGKLLIGRTFFNSSAGAYSTSKIEGYTPKEFNTQDNIIEEDLKITVLDSEQIAIRAVSMFTSNKQLTVWIVKDPANPSKLVVAKERDMRLKKKERDARDKKLTAEMEARGIFIENYTFNDLKERGLERAQLVEAAKGAFPKYIKSGMEGGFTTFGDWSLRPATTIIFLDPLSPDKDGEYLIMSVNKSFGNDGIRQKVVIPHRVKKIDRKTVV